MSTQKYSTQELDDFERRTGITLPDAYRRHLCEVGAGQLNAQDGISLLEDWCQPSAPEDLSPDFLRQPFPFTDAWNDITLKDPKAGWNAPYYDEAHFRGSMRIKNIGCEGYHLLVVSGDERGNVWADERASYSKGIYPLRHEGCARMTINEYLAQL